MGFAISTQIAQLLIFLATIGVLLRSIRRISKANRELAEQVRRLTQLGISRGYIIPASKCVAASAKVDTHTFATVLPFRKG